MYNLFVSGNENDWNGVPFIVHRSRCVSRSEYTDPGVADRLGDLSAGQVRELCSLPCIFAYEKGCGKDPKFGVLRGIKGRSGRRLQIEYTLIPCEPFATADDLESHSSLLDIGGWELGRTHWAVKDVDLALELGRMGIALPGWATRKHRTVDIRQHQFEVALSFPGEQRGYVERVADELERLLGENTCFYDRYYESQLAQPSLDMLLQEIYGERSSLVVVFVCRDYDKKAWCGIEWEKIRERRVVGDKREIMYVRLDSGDVAGMTRLDGYVDARERSPQDVARLIVERVEVADRSNQK